MVLNCTMSCRINPYALVTIFRLDIDGYFDAFFAPKATAPRNNNLVKVLTVFSAGPMRTESKHSRINER